MGTSWEYHGIFSVPTRICPRRELGLGTKRLGFLFLPRRGQGRDHFQLGAMKKSMDFSVKEIWNGAMKNRTNHAEGNGMATFSS